ncbi:MAG: hypothetical protein LBF79_03580 [Dysgonamonadaceae bacterium]|jgi:hypothetical protein|nr:hypothetical protein [Dysgonamonadaceae bacterium]
MCQNILFKYRAEGHKKRQLSQLSRDNFRAQDSSPDHLGEVAIGRITLPIISGRFPCEGQLSRLSRDDFRKQDTSPDYLGAIAAGNTTLPTISGKLPTVRQI